MRNHEIHEIHERKKTEKEGSSARFLRWGCQPLSVPLPLPSFFVWFVYFVVCNSGLMPSFDFVQFAQAAVRVEHRRRERLGEVQGVGFAQSLLRRAGAAEDRQAAP